MKQLYSKHFGRAVVYTLLALFLYVAGVGKAAAKTNYDPIVRLNSVSYTTNDTEVTTNGTEVTLQLYMWYYSSYADLIQEKAWFKGDVNLYIDDKQVVKLNDMWSNISGVTDRSIFINDQKTYRGKPVGNTSDIIVDNKIVGTAKFCNLKVEESNPNYVGNNNYVCVIDLKLSFNSSFPYYGHKLTVKGKWYNKENYSSQEEDWTLDNTISGYVRPANLKVEPYDNNYMDLSWEKQGYNKSASDNGEWIVYKRENGERKKLRSTNNNKLLIAKSEHTCLSNYDVTFKPRGFSTTDTICGLTTSYIATGHKLNADDVCQYCNHSFFRYTTSDGKIVDKISNPSQFGANIVAHSVVDGKCVIEFDGPITKIPDQAFYKCKNLTGDLVIPNSVTEIGESAFSCCTGFNSTLTLSSKLKTIGNSAFYLCIGFTGSLTLPSSVTTIGNWAFKECYRFTGSLTLPSSVTTIGNWAFMNCYGFTKLELPNTLSVIPDGAFYCCSSLSGELEIPASVTEIGTNAFYGCQNLSAEKGRLTLPKSLKKIGNKVFTNTNNINIVKFQSLPEGISEYLGNGRKKAVSLSDDSYISDQASGTVNEISYTRLMSNDWGTLVLPYSLTLTGEESYRLYAIDKIDGNELVLIRIEGTVAAGTPCVVKRNGTEAKLTFGANDAELNMAISDQNVGGMTFHGTYTTKEVNSGYVISKDCFWNVAELMSSNHVKGAKVSPFRAWLDGNAASGPARLAMRIDGSTTGINTPDALDVLNDAEAEYYDLSGKRLHEPQKGVNIVRMKSGKTKKIIIK